MKFSEKLKAARTKAGMTQAELAEASGITCRSIVNYESGAKYPRTHKIYQRLAEALHIDETYLRNEDEEFVLSAEEKYGNRGARQAERLIADMSALYAGGDLSDEDKDVVMKALQDIYWQSKARNVEKYTPKKFRDNSPD